MLLLKTTKKNNSDAIERYERERERVIIVCEGIQGDLWDSLTNNRNRKSQSFLVHSGAAQL
jgi:hypothetical protein